MRKGDNSPSPVHCMNSAESLAGACAAPQILFLSRYPPSFSLLDNIIFASRCLHAGRVRAHSSSARAPECGLDLGRRPNPNVRPLRISISLGGANKARAPFLLFRAGKTAGAKKTSASTKAG